MSAQVKIMLSYDYCHFEVTKGTDEDLSNKEINEMRKDVQRLVDEAVRQYKKAKEMENKRLNIEFEYEILSREVEKILKIPEVERSAEQRAKVKAMQDKNYWNSFKYDYEDDDDSPF